MLLHEHLCVAHATVKEVTQTVAVALDLHCCLLLLRLLLLPVRVRR